MTLEEDVGPVCVEGVEKELAVAKAYESGMIPKNERRSYNLIQGIVLAYSAMAGFLLSADGELPFAMGAVLAIGAVITEIKGCIGYENWASSLLKDRFKNQ